ncbi:MAG: amidohydrolase [Parafannyhessea sp.]|uniref:amidohydrolase n=1 Tax=Parafannyhessea sp. TaxID=2847324 RepID=UPI003F010717
MAQETNGIPGSGDAMTGGPSDAMRLAPELRRWRRELHQIPECDFDLPETIGYLRAQLDRMSRRCGCLKVFSPAPSTLCALFDRGTSGATALRADMDALPVTEETGVTFASRHQGRMHACGHDGHMAMALGACAWMSEHSDLLPRSVLVVFQPAEETTGGARKVCESGVFGRLGVDRIFGFHLWPDLPEAQVATRVGALLAASNETTVEFRGRASHIAKASQGRDALLAGCRFVPEAYRYMDERGLEEPCLLRFGHMTAGEVRNQIAATARVEGSLRTFSVAMGERCRNELPRIAERVAAGLGCTARTHFSEGYPPVVNDHEVTSWARGVLESAGIAVDMVKEPLLIAEDFAWYQQWLPGTFFLLGTGTGIPLHASTFDFDERVLVRGVDVYRSLVTADL